MALNKTDRPTRITFGDNGQRGKKGILSVTFVSRAIRKPTLGTTTGFLAATATSGSVVTTIPMSSTPKNPRSITVTLTGTAGDVKAAAITVNGTNLEGKPISDTVTPTLDTLGTLETTKAFKTVTSIVVPAQDGGGVLVSAGGGSKFGIGYRNVAAASVKLYKSVAGVETLVNPSATNLSSTVVENNTVTLDVAANGTNDYRVYAMSYNWHLNPDNDEPVYGA
jgi:hypothetical protein